MCLHGIAVSGQEQVAFKPFEAFGNSEYPFSSKIATISSGKKPSIILLD